MVLTLCYFCPHYAFYMWITVLTKDNKDNSVVVCCYADQHNIFFNDSFNNLSHGNMIHSIIDSCKPDDYKFIVEDRQDYRGTNASVQELYQRLPSNQIISLLHGLAEYSRKKGFDVSNVECRFVREIALDPLFYPCLGTRLDIPAKGAVEEFEDTVKIVQQYDDDPKLNAYYKYQLDNVIKVSEDLREILRAFEMPLFKFAEEHIPPSKWLAFAIHFLEWDSSLLDMQAVHEVVTAKDKKKIALFMGAAHIFPVTQALIQFGGYKYCKTIGTEQWYGCNPVTSFNLDQLEEEATINAKIEENKKKVYTPLTEKELEVLLEDIP